MIGRRAQGGQGIGAKVTDDRLPIGGGRAFHCAFSAGLGRADLPSSAHFIVGILVGSQPCPPHVSCSHDPVQCLRPARRLASPPSLAEGFP
jgi:hypothetical protein